MPSVALPPWARNWTGRAYEPCGRCDRAKLELKVGTFRLTLCSLCDVGDRKPA